MAERNITVGPEGKIHTCDGNPLQPGDELYRIEDGCRSHYGTVHDFGEAGLQVSIPDVTSYGQRYPSR